MNLLGMFKFKERYRICCTNEDGRIDPCTDGVMLTVLKVTYMDTNTDIEFEFDIQNNLRECSVTDEAYYNKVDCIKVLELLLI